MVFRWPKPLFFMVLGAHGGVSLFHRGHPGLRFYDIQLNIKSEKGTDLQTIEDLRAFGVPKGVGFLKRALLGMLKMVQRKNQPLAIEHQTLKSHMFLKCFVYIFLYTCLC